MAWLVYRDDRGRVQGISLSHIESFCEDGEKLTLWPSLNPKEPYVVERAKVLGIYGDDFLERRWKKK